MICRNQRGDTIVEVMLALAILGLIIGGAYASASRNLRSARASQERAEAVKLAENQFEQLKLLAPLYADPNRDIFRGQVFCINDSHAIRQLASAPVADAAADTFSSPNPYPSDCIKDGRYYYSIQYDAAQHDRFTVRVRWDRIGGGRDEVRMLYRIHKI